MSNSTGSRFITRANPSLHGGTLTARNNMVQWGGGVYNGNFHAAFCVHGLQLVYHAETIAFALASELAIGGEEVILDNQGVVNATPIKRKGFVKDQAHRDIGYHNASTKQLTIRSTPGHRTLEQATTFHNYKGIEGNNHSNVLANMGDNLPMDS